MITIPGRIPITIHPLFWVLCFGLGFYSSKTVNGTLIWVAIILISVLVHEFGHALTAVAFGQQAQIDLVALGGLTSRSGKQLKRWKEFVIILCGPLAGLLLAGIAFFARIALQGEVSPVLLDVLKLACFVNVFWTLLNLLPIQPMDGGKLLSILLEGIFGVRGIKISLFISLLLASGFALLSFMISQLLLGSIFFMFAFESFREWQQAKSMTAQDQDEGLRDLLHDAEKELQQGHFVEAEQKLQQLKVQSKGGVLDVAASVYLAQIWTRQQKYVEAYQLLKPVASQLEGEAIPLMQQLAWKAGEIKVAAKYGDEAYQIDPTYHTALLNAFCHSLLGEVEPAIGWLQRAIGDGLPNVSQILQRKEFDPIRNDPDFRQITDCT